MYQHEDIRTVDNDFAPDILCMRYRDIEKRTESEEKKLQLAWFLSDMGPDSDFNKVPPPW